MGARLARQASAEQPTTYKDLREYFLAINSLADGSSVTLEQAVTPLIPVLPTIETYARLVKQKCASPADGLTPDESAAVMLYSMGWQPLNECLYIVLNTTLRSMNRQSLEPWSPYMKLLLNAAQRLPSTHLTVYRENGGDLSAQYVAGEQFTWWDFSLCATSIDRFRAAHTVFAIESHAVKDIRKHTYTSTDDTVLILPGTRFQVLECSSGSIGIREVQPSFLLQARAPPRRKSKTFFSKNCSPSKKSKPSESPEYYRHVSLEQLIAQSDGGWTVDLDERNVTDRDMRVVVKNAIVKKRCKRIRLRDNHITSEGALTLANGLQHNVLLESLDLRNNCIGDKGVQVLASAVARSNLKTLNLESNDITCDGAVFLAQMLRSNNSLTELYLSKNQLGDRGTELIANALTDDKRNNAEQEIKVVSTSNACNVQHLYLGHNGITDVGLEHLAEMLKSNRMLTWLWLSGNEIGNRGVELLAVVLAAHNNSLEWLFLNSNRAIDDACVDSLSSMLKRNHSLKTIYLNNCHLSDAAKATLETVTKFKKDFDLEV